jgi:hypothetical protein
VVSAAGVTAKKAADMKSMIPWVVASIALPPYSVFV